MINHMTQELRMNARLCQCGYSMMPENDGKGHYRIICSTTKLADFSKRSQGVPLTPDGHDRPTDWADSIEDAWLAWKAEWILSR
jgi:hypothetical protein